jgi:thiosulfate dehydrogenase
MPSDNPNSWEELVEKIVGFYRLWSYLLLIILISCIAYFAGGMDNLLSKSNQNVDAEYGKSGRESEKPKDDLWRGADISAVPSNAEGELIRYGRDLIAQTSEYFGPKGQIRQTTNGMNCQNCHLEAGTKPWGNNYGAVASTYPKYRARSGEVENLYKRINDCFERSLNGKALDTAGKEMQAIKAYIEWLGKDVKKGEKPKGSGIYELSYLDRPADPEKGKSVYIQHCQSCHQEDGEGVLNSAGTAFQYPPLWGSRSYNDGAGLYRLSRFAGYVKYNMPQGVTYENPLLTDEEAWDVAAYVNSQSRPKKDIRNDWPKIEEKPVDHPFGPFADGFSAKQHKYGPFGPIKEFKSHSKK